MRRGKWLGRGWAAGVAALALAVFAPSAALANQYTVEICTNLEKAVDGVPANATDGQATGLLGGSGPIYAHACEADGAGNGQVKLGSTDGTVEEPGEGFWLLAAPPGGRIVSVELTRSFQRTKDHPSLLWWSLASPNTQFDDEKDFGFAGIPPEETHNYQVNAAQFHSTLFCFGQGSHKCTGSGGSAFSVTLKNIVAVLDDPSPPTFIAPPSLPSGGLRGRAAVGLNAFDTGAGIATGAVIVDGQRLPPFSFGKEDTCHAPFKRVAPCLASFLGTVSFDTTQFADGPHELKIELVDGSGAASTSESAPFLVHNAPVNAVRPVIRGTQTVGGRVGVEVGRWIGTPTSYAYQWLRCPASTREEGDSTGCAPVPGASGAEYVPTAEDAGARLLVVVTASNSAGSGSAVSLSGEVIAKAAPPAPPPKHPHRHKKANGPKISHVTLSAKRFRVLDGTTGKGRGAILGFNCSRAGNLSLLIERVHGKAKPTRVAKLVAKIKPGRSKVQLGGEIGQGRLLSAGSYQVTLQVRDAKGRQGKPVSVPFTIAPG